VLQIVAPTRIPYSLSAVPDRMGVISSTLIHVVHVPEPRTGLLLGFGATLVGWLGWRKRSS
jgi:hypothetical protein